MSKSDRDQSHLWWGFWLACSHLSFYTQINQWPSLASVGTDRGSSLGWKLTGELEKRKHDSSTDTNTLFWKHMANQSFKLRQKLFCNQSEQILPCVRSCLSDTVFLSSFSSLLSRTHSSSLASSSSCKSYTHKHTPTFKFTFPSCCQPKWLSGKTIDRAKEVKDEGKRRKAIFGKKGA